MRGLAAAALLLVAGCAGWPLAGLPRVADCPGPLRDVADIPGGDFSLRERARVVAPEVDLALELLAERRGDRLVLVAIDVFGARLFSVVQTGSAVEADSRFGRAQPIEPETLLRDLHAARFARAESEPRTTVRREGCSHRTTFVRVERRAL